jgi:acetoin utilization deacetylase AcuC-like enzyme
MENMHIVYTEKHRLHDTNDVSHDGRPFVTEELPARAEVILEAVEAAQLGSIIRPVDYGVDPILAAHDAGFVEFIRTAYAESAAYFKEAGPVFTWSFATRHQGRKPKGFLALKGYYSFGWGTPILEGTWEAAYWSAQCALTAAEVVRGGEQVAYALCRPPGHHAGLDLYGGFCYLNNAAIVARHLQARVAILDIDYHHGNGTQTIFYSDPSVLYCSLHAHPDLDYPYYWGYADETGQGEGRGTNRNFPLPLGVDDEVYLATLSQALQVIHDFCPRFLVVSAGFDTVAGDPVGSFSLTTDGLARIGKAIAGLSLPTVVLQEGGYLIERLGENAVAFLGRLLA